MREKNTGVSGVTNRMELVQRLRNNLVKSRLTSMVLGIVVAILVVTVAILAKELKDTKQMINNYSKLEITLNHEINELKVNIDDETQSTTATPVSGKVIVVDAGHGVPDERSTE